jgi:hypothetical protein
MRVESEGFGKREGSRENHHRNKRGKEGVEWVYIKDGKRKH